jgi:hypothetical protein
MNKPRVLYFDWDVHHRSQHAVEFIGEQLGVVFSMKRMASMPKE